MPPSVHVKGPKVPIPVLAMPCVIPANDLAIGDRRLDHASDTVAGNSNWRATGAAASSAKYGSARERSQSLRRVALFASHQNHAIALLPVGGGPAKATAGPLSAIVLYGEFEFHDRQN
jgi:hypothetical protein